MATSFDTALSNLGIGRTGPNQAPAATAKTTLGQDDFLALMTAQLKNQDPFEPVDNTQMVAQMAQFSSLAGITEMSSTLKSIADKLNGTTTTDALGWVGRTVLTEGDVAFARTSGGIAGAVELDAEATGVAVTITSSTGEVLNTMSLGPQAAGTVEFDWDGKNTAGEDAGTGPFQVTVAARNGDESVTARPLVWAPVTSVSIRDGEPVLQLPGIGQIQSSSVRSVG